MANRFIYFLIILGQFKKAVFLQTNARIKYIKPKKVRNTEMHGLQGQLAYLNILISTAICITDVTWYDYVILSE